MSYRIITQRYGIVDFHAKTLNNVYNLIKKFFFFKYLSVWIYYLTCDEAFNKNIMFYIKLCKQALVLVL